MQVSVVHLASMLVALLLFLSYAEAQVISAGIFSAWISLVASRFDFATV
jgi:hypothetical protein